MMMISNKIFSSLQFFTLLYLFTVIFASTDEATALLKWKASFKNQNNSLLASWTPSSNACRDWYGVTCFNGRLNTLNITNSNVIGTLYAFPFSSLPFLENLDLSRNEFSGTIPHEIGNLTNLVFLNLNFNQISGTIPRQIGSLAKLQTLCISVNHLNGSIPEETGCLRSLTKLSLATNSLNGSIPEEIGHLRSLTDLDLSSNSLNGSIPRVLGDLVAIRVLNLSHNGLKGHIPPSLGSLSVVESLELSFNQLSGEIPQQLASLTSLEFLNLSHNYLQGCIPQGPQFNTFENNSYEGNDGLRGFPVSKGCGNGTVLETNYTVSALDDQESNSEFLNDFWKAALMGYGSGLCIGVSIIYFMISTGNLKWLARIIEELECKIIMRRRKKQRGQRNYRRRNNRF